jgi:MFS family permease
MQNMTNSLLIYRLTGSAVLLGTMGLANGLPIVLFSLFGGVIADRLQKKYILLLGLGGQALVALIVALALTTGYLSASHAGSWWLLLVTSFLQGSINGFMLPAQRAVIPELVNRQQVTNAIALNTMANNTLVLLAPAATGFIIDALDFKAVFFGMTALYTLGTIFMFFIPLTGRAIVRSGGVGTALLDIKEGFKYIRRETVILLILGWSFCGMSTMQVYTRLMPIFADDIVKVGAKGMGLWLSAAGVGALISSLTVASLPLKRRGFTHVSGSIIQASSMIGFAFFHSWYPNLGLAFLVGLGQTTGMMMSQTLLQSYSADEYRGRVFSVQVLQQGVAGMAQFLVGLMAAAFGAVWTEASVAMTMIFLGIMTLLFIPRYRRLP